MPELVTLTGPMTERFLCWSAETVLVGTVLASVAAIACLVDRRRPALGPSARHALWLVVLLKLMTPPLVHWPWSIRVAGAEPVEERRVGLSDESEAVALGPAPVSVVDPAPAEVPTARDSDPVAVTWSSLGAVARGIGPWVVAAWLTGSVALGAGQVRRIGRFRRRLRDAEPAPGWLVDEAARVGRRLGVRVPAIRVLPGLGTPLLWCLGRPVLLVPDDLLGSLEPARWRAILAHELAHLRRLDPWVRRLELLAGLVWWWNPLYRLTRRRLDFEAELACDAWVLWALPDDRFAYAESLIQIGSIPPRSPAATPAPSLGVAGTARSFERRLTMILRDQVAYRPTSGLVGAALLTLLALPSWTLAEPARTADEPAAPAVAAVEVTTTDFFLLDDPDAIARPEAADDDDEPGDDDAKAAKQRAEKLKEAAKERAERQEAAKERAEAAAERARAAKKRAEGAREKAKAAKEAFAKDAPARRGNRPAPEEMAEFEKRMEAMGKEMEKKFGPGSEFEKKMKAMAKEMEEKFGPDSKFEKEMKAMGEKMAKEFGPGSKFAEEMKDRAKKAAEDGPKAEPKARETRVRVERSTARTRTDTATVRRTRRIEALEAQIKKMTEELKRLKAEGDEDEEG